MEAFLILVMTFVTVFRILFIFSVVIAKDIYAITKYKRINHWFILQLIGAAISPNIWLCLIRKTLNKLLLVQFVFLAIGYGFFLLIGYKSMAEFVLYFTLLEIFMFIPILQSKIATQSSEILSEFK